LVKNSLIGKNGLKHGTKSTGINTIFVTDPNSFRLDVNILPNITGAFTSQICYKPPVQASIATE